MIKFTTELLGNVVIKFRHFLPDIEIPAQNNSLTSMVRAIKLTQGQTLCQLQLGVESSEDGLLSVEVEFYGRAFTHPNDNYKKEIGRVLSLTRAVDEAVKSGTITAAAAREVMAGYYSRSKKK